MTHNQISLHLPARPKSPEEIRNKIGFYENKKRAIATTASHFKGGKHDPAIATKLLIYDVRQQELRWCLSDKPTIHA